MFSIDISQDFEWLSLLIAGVNGRIQALSHGLAKAPHRTDWYEHDEEWEK
jgi:hypothetical protein